MHLRLSLPPLASTIECLCLHAYFFMMCTLHKNIPFYVLYPFMSFKQCFMKVFTIFSSFEVWYISPLNTWKQQDLDFACFQGGKTSKFKSRKNRLKSTFSHFFFYTTYYFGKRHDMIQCTTFKNHFLKNTCNLRHSNARKSETPI